MATKAASSVGWEISASTVVDNVDIRSLDQNHVIPNMGVVVNHGVWFPKLS